ncbi:MAG: nucleoside deaminase [Dehalococcoidia bacterium]|jgi:tRNA(Arg) A34 adenosine deaminase TadA
MDDEKWLRSAFRLAEQARASGDQPFGAVLVAADGRILGEALNTRNVARDLTGHAETNVIRSSTANGWSDFPSATLYASTEPCMMCAGLIAWSGIGRVVFGLSQAQFGAIPTQKPPRFAVPPDIRTLLAGLNSPVEIVGPLLADEAWAVHQGYWK